MKKRRTGGDRAGITIRGGGDPKSINVMAAALVKLMSTPCGDDVKRHAIEALRKHAGVENTVITNCNFTVGDRE